MGSFDERFLEVPEPVVVSAMRSHQRYFAMQTHAGKLAIDDASNFMYTMPAYSVSTIRIGAPGGTDAPPTVANAASAAPNPVTGTTTGLSVLGADDGGEGHLAYTWSVVGTPPATVQFSINDSNAAKDTVATFASAGSYTLRATISDGLLSTTSDVCTASRHSPS